MHFSSNPSLPGSLATPAARQRQRAFLFFAEDKIAEKNGRKMGFGHPRQIGEKLQKISCHQESANFLLFFQDDGKGGVEFKGGSLHDGFGGFDGFGGSGEHLTLLLLVLQQNTAP